MRFSIGRCATPASSTRSSRFVARLGRGREFHHDAPWASQAAAVRGGWYVPMLTAVRMLRLSPLGVGRCALVATLGGFVVFGADVAGSSYDSTGIADVRSRNVPNRSFELEPPGAWYAALRETWLPLSTGSTSTMWGAPTTTPSKVDSLRANYEHRAILAAIAGLTESRAALRAAAARGARPPGRR